MRATAFDVFIVSIRIYLEAGQGNRRIFNWQVCFAHLSSDTNQFTTFHYPAQLYTANHKNIYKPRCTHLNFISSSPYLQALRVPLRLHLASRPTHASGCTGPSITTTLSILLSNSARASSWSCGGSRRRACSGGWRSTTPSASRSKLSIDESQSRLSVLGTIALVSGLVATCAAVRIGCVAVRLDLRSRWAHEASWARCELGVCQYT